MIVLLFAVPIVAFCILLIHHVGSGVGGDRPQPPLEEVRPATSRARAADDIIGAVSQSSPGWTALDDHQLDRLLRDSS